MIELELGVMHFEYGGRRPGVKECRWPLEAGKSKETDFPLKSPEGMQLCCTLILDF